MSQLIRPRGKKKNRLLIAEQSFFILSILSNKKYNPLRAVQKYKPLQINRLLRSRRKARQERHCDRRVSALTINLHSFFCPLEHGSFSDRPPSLFNSRSEECNVFNRGSDQEINKTLSALSVFAVPGSNI